MQEQDKKKNKIRKEWNVTCRVLILQLKMLWYPIVVAEAEGRSIALTHPKTKIKQRDTKTKIYVVWRKEILLHPPMVANHYNQSVYYLSHYKVSFTKFFLIASERIQNSNDPTSQNNVRQVFI